MVLPANQRKYFVKRFALCFLLGAVGDLDGVTTEYSFSFLGSQFDGEYFRLLGSEDVKAWDFIHREAAGLRMALPAGTDVQMVGFANRFPVRGDFEITAKYTILKCDSPDQGYGAGPGIYIKTLSTSENAAVLARLNRPAEGDVYSSYVATLRRDGTHWQQPMFTETNSVSGSLRLVRNGETLEYSVAEGRSRDFHVIRHVRLGCEDVVIVRTGVDKGGSAGAIEVVWEELTIRMRPSTGLKTSWGLVLVVVLFLVGGTLYLFSRRLRSRNQQNRIPFEQL